MGCACCVAAIAEYERLDVPGNVEKVGKALADELDKLAEKHTCIGEARHIGLFAQIELVKDRATKEPLSVPDAGKVVGMLKAAGFATYNNLNGIMVAPPLIITKKELLEGLAILDKVLDEVDKW
jgi:taurine--2-oxoglutarate transaminase